MIVYNKKSPIIIIPAYCPDEKLIKLVNEIRNNTMLPIIIVDDGSGKKYKNIFVSLGKVHNCFIYSNKINEGKGHALKKAVKYGKEKYPYNYGYVTCDADGQHSVEDIMKVVKSLIENDNCLVLGVRDFNTNNVPTKSKIGNIISSFVFYFTTGRRCKDTQTGLRGIPKDYEDIFISEKGDRYEFEMNFLITMAKKQIPFREVKIQTIYIDDNEASHFKPIKDSVIIFSGIFKYTCSSIVSSTVDLLLFTILYGTVGIIVSTIIARICSGSINFFINQNWVFKGCRDKMEIVKYSILFLIQMITSGILVSALTAIIKNATLNKVLVDSILFFISYIVQKNIVFKKLI